MNKFMPKMYDIFQPACRQCNCAWAEQKKQLNDLEICRKMITVKNAVAIFGRLRYDIDVKPTVRLLYQQVDTRNMEVNNEKNNENK